MSEVFQTARPVYVVGGPTTRGDVIGYTLTAKAARVAGSPPPDGTPKAVLGRNSFGVGLAHRGDFGGTFRVAGVTRIAGVPTAATIMLIDQRTGAPLAETTSLPTDGQYEFLGVGPGPFTVLAKSLGGDLQAVIADNIYAEKIT